MLQQTQVATVVPYFQRFICRFPSVEQLAAADEQDVLSLWEGLGYYRRARQLHAAAKQIVSNFSGNFPRESKLVQSLPGIGRYTAGAILSIAFDQREPILEANSIRVLCRLTGYKSDPQNKQGQAYLWGVAEQLLPREGVGDFNQSLMELGSLICTPKSPNCENCPVRSVCRARELGQQTEIPLPKRRPEFTSVRHVAIATLRHHEVLMRQCQEGERWFGLWDFPRFELPEADQCEAKIGEHVHSLTGIKIRPGRELASWRHGVTRYRIHLVCYLATPIRGRLLPNARWVPISDLDGYPLNTTGRKIARSLKLTNGEE